MSDAPIQGVEVFGCALLAIGFGGGPQEFAVVLAAPIELMGNSFGHS